MRCEEAQELITGLVDGELSRPESFLIEAHLPGCPKCQWVYAAEQALKRRVREAAGDIRAPSVLREKILHDRRAFLRKGRFAEIREEVFRLRRFAPRAVAFAAALILLLALPTFYWSRSTHLPVAPAVFQNYAQLAQGEIKPIRTESMIDLKERLVRSVNGRFAPMAYDFSAMDLRLVGGLVQEIAGRQVLVTVYEGNGSIVVCYTFLGSEADAPADAEMLFDLATSINFYQFSKGQANAVMHREGEVMCILVSGMPMRDLLVLSRSKAYPS